MKYLLSLICMICALALAHQAPAAENNRPVLSTAHGDDHDDHGHHHDDEEEEDEDDDEGRDDDDDEDEDEDEDENGPRDWDDEGRDDDDEWEEEDDDEGEEDDEEWDEDDEEWDEDEAEEVAEILEELHKRHPGLAAALTELQQTDPEWFMEVVDHLYDELAWAMEEAGELGPEGEQELALSLNEAELRLRAEMLAGQLQELPAEERRARSGEVEAVVAELFNTMVERRRIQLATIEAEVEERRAELQRFIDKRDAAIKAKVNSLLGEDLANW